MKKIVRMGGREVTLEWTSENGIVKAAIREGGQVRTREVSVHQVEPGVYSMLADSRSFEVRVVKPVRQWLVQAAGGSWTAEVVDPRAAVARRAGLGSEGRQMLAAPMPGKVVRVLVEEGAAVEAGQGLIVVEAMKMQNEVKAPRAGRVIALAARAGASVTAGEVLVTLE